MMIIATGSQGEKRAALVRGGTHPKIKLEAGGSCLVFFPREIPGNEKAIFAVQYLLRPALMLKVS